ncbi:MAG: M20/M25/M40 family metallo-hydrolase [Lachnospiraceae bacterium]|nr:M20/M25/M40 family metallo-hydrolase [Lachnospiraceae bacterium]
MESDKKCGPERTQCADEEPRPVIVFIAHMDVVFPDTEELPLEEREGRICCPGVGDDTANLAVLLLTAEYAAQRRPDTGGYDILFVCGVGEEGLGNLKGSREICSAFGDRIKAFYALDLTSDSYLCRSVGSLRYRVCVTARGGHSYHCFGNTNANAVLAEIITALYRVRVPQNGSTTYNVGVISGGTSVNTIAQHAELLYEIRSDDVRDLEIMRGKFYDIIEKYQKTLPSDCSVELELIGERPCEKNVDTEKRQRLFACVEKAVEEACGKRPVPAAFSTDCNIPLSLGIPSVCVGTYRGAGAHTREEYIEKDSLAEGLEIALRLLEGCTSCMDKS